DGEAERRSETRLEPPERKALVAFEERADLVTLRFEDFEVALVLARVASLLGAERFDLGAELRIVDAIEVMTHAPDEEALAGGKEQIDAVDDVSGDGALGKPVLRDRAIERKIHATGTDQRAGNGAIEQQSISTALLNNSQ